MSGSACIHTGITPLKDSAITVNKAPTVKAAKTDCAAAFAAFS